MSKPEDVRALIARAYDQTSAHTWSRRIYFVFGEHPDGHVDVDDEHGDVAVHQPRDVAERLIASRQEALDAVCEHARISADLADACEQLLDLVRRLQWGDSDGSGGGGFCPVCGRPGREIGETRATGKHAPSCPIAALGLPAEDE